MGRCWLGVDVGGTNIRMGIVDQAGLRETAAFPTLAERGPDDVLGRLGAAARDMLQKAQALGLKPLGVGAACPGAIDRERGVALLAHNLPGWRNIPLASKLARSTGLGVVVENDANLYALGEYAFGRFKGNDMACFTLGTGVGGGLILDGRLVTGPLGIGGELGHLIVNSGGRRCTCGSLGCVEAYASATGITGMLKQASAREKGGGPAPGFDARQAAQAAREGDKAAIEAFEQAGTALGRAFCLVALAFGIDLMLIGGGVAPAWPLMEKSARRELAAGLHMIDYRSIRMERAGLGNDAPLLGAAARAKQKFSK